MPNHSIKIGSVLITSVIESDEPVLSPWEIFPDCDSKSLLKARSTYNSAHFGVATNDPQLDRLRIRIQGFVIEADGLRILIDTCVGDCKLRNRSEFNKQNRQWHSALRASGYEPDSIDLVVCTHLHVDHVGGNTLWDGKQWVPAFANARYLVTQADWDHWSAASTVSILARTGDYISDSLLPLMQANVLDLVSVDHRISESIRLIPAPGHSPGMVMVRVENAGRCLTLTGDLLHSPIQCLQPHWSTRFCSDPDESRKTRLYWLKYFSKSDEYIWPAHFSQGGFGKVSATGDHYFFEFDA
jgi:glyoxylase-like metal-dependent hydrolase (beta-lactamase superfamily II)